MHVIMSPILGYCGLVCGQHPGLKGGHPRYCIFDFVVSVFRYCLCWLLGCLWLSCQVLVTPEISAALLVGSDMIDTYNICLLLLRAVGAVGGCLRSEGLHHTWPGT